MELPHPLAMLRRAVAMLRRAAAMLRRAAAMLRRAAAMLRREELETHWNVSVLRVITRRQTALTRPSAKADQRKESPVPLPMSPLLLLLCMAVHCKPQAVATNHAGRSTTVVEWMAQS